MNEVVVIWACLCMAIVAVCVVLLAIEYIRDKNWKARYEYLHGSLIEAAQNQERGLVPIYESDEAAGAGILRNLAGRRYIRWADAEVDERTGW